MTSTIVNDEIEASLINGDGNVGYWTATTDFHASTNSTLTITDLGATTKSLSNLTAIRSHRPEYLAIP